MHELLLERVIAGDRKSLARCISLIENESKGYEDILHALPPEKPQPVIGVTGSPGAGKSTLVDSLIGEFVKQEQKIAVICIDPSSAFHRGALLGDRIRMSDWYNNENVFIRSFATRGSLGGLNAAIIEILLLINCCDFDFVIVETVGVGQSEVDIAKLADLTIVVLVPEGGDEIQTMKAGLMEVADIFVVNKSDRPGADMFVNNLKQVTAPGFTRKKVEIPVLKTIASQKEGTDSLMNEIIRMSSEGSDSNNRADLLADRAWQLIQKLRMNDLELGVLRKRIKEKLDEGGFRLYGFVEEVGR